MTLNPILPNSATENDIREYFIQRSTDVLRLKAGYKPEKLPEDILKQKLHSMNEKVANHTNHIMRVMSQNSLPDANPRVPYLMSLWLTIGVDNKYNRFQFKPEADELRNTICDFKLMFDEPDDDCGNGDMTKSDIEKELHTWINETVNMVANDAKRRCDGTEKQRQVVYQDTLKEAHTAIEKQAIEWAYLTDEELLDACLPLAWTLYTHIRLYRANENLIDEVRTFFTLAQ